MLLYFFDLVSWSYYDGYFRVYDDWKVFLNEVEFDIFGEDIGCIEML